jgi:hypothetical protein
VREVIVDPRKMFYDPNTAPHHHFYNLVSGELTNIPADALQVSGLPTLPAGIDVIVWLLKWVGLGFLFEGVENDAGRSF